jgi:hypothetical protein
VVISQTAEAVPDQVKRLIFICTFMPGHGESLQTWATKDTESLIGPNLIDNGDGTASLKNEALKNV